MSEDRHYLRPKQVARLCNVTERTLNKWRQVGYGPPFLIFRGRVQYEAHEFETWLDLCRGPARGELLRLNYRLALIFGAQPQPTAMVI